MTIGIIGAMTIEVETLKQMMENVVIHKIGIVEFFTGSLSGVNVVVAVSGVGKVSSAICTQTMIFKFNPNFIINVGVAGGIDEKLKIGDIAIATGVVQHDMDTSPLGDKIGYISGLDLVEIPCSAWAVDLLEQVAKTSIDVATLKGIIASGDQFINTQAKKNWIQEQFQAIAVEMEGASIGHVCYANHVEFCIIRAISDSADEESPISFPAFTEMAVKNSMIIIIKFLEKVKEMNDEKN